MSRWWLAAVLWWPAGGYALVGNTLLGWCQQHLTETRSGSGSAATTGAGAACMSYLAGVVDTITVGQRWDQWNVNVCVPKEAKTAEIVQIYTAWALRHPEALYLPASSSVARALNEAFPCR